MKQRPEVSGRFPRHGLPRRAVTRSCGMASIRIWRISWKCPRRQGPVERELNIKREASYIIAVKNPETPSPLNSGLGRKQEAEFPKELQEKFRGRRFIPVDPADFLNYEGAEIILIGARENAEE